MKKIILFPILIFSLHGCATSGKVNAKLQNLPANELCNQFIMSKYNASEFRFSSLVNELTKRGISVSECSKTGFSEFLNKNLPQTPKPNFSNNSNSKEIKKLKEEIKNLKSKTDDLESENNSNKNKFQGMEKWRKERDERLRF